MLLRETIESVLANPLRLMPVEREVMRGADFVWPVGHALVLTGESV